MSPNSDTSPRVNSARMPDYMGRTVRLIGKVERIDNNTNTAIVKASDGGEVRIKLIPGNSQMRDPYVEIIGTVVEQDMIKMVSCINHGSDLDISLADFLVEKWHDPKFAKMF